MEHIFDNRQLLQSLVVQGGCKASATSPSRKYSLSFEEVKRFFLQNLSDIEFLKLKEHLLMESKQQKDDAEIILWCMDVMTNTLTNHRAMTVNVSSKMSLRELFMEKIAVNGSAYAITFLRKYFFNERKMFVPNLHSKNSLRKAA